MQTRLNFKLFIALLLVLGVSFSLAPIAKAQSFDVEKSISSGDHKGLAEYYKSQAEAQRKIAEMHDKMRADYKNNHNHVHYKGYENVLAGHCGNLKFQALKMAEQYDALAKQEENLAAKAK